MDRLSLVRRGIKESLPLALGYIPVAITFGILAKAYGMPSYLPILMSIFIYAGSSQFVAIQMMSLGTAPVQMILTIFIVNIRHFLMGSTLTQKLPKAMTLKQRGILSYFLTDEAFVYMTHQEVPLKFHYMLGFQVTLYASWVFGTVVGAMLLTNISPMISVSLGITIYALFISLLIPAARRSSRIALLCIGAGLGSFLLGQTPISTGWRIVIVTVVAALLGAIFIREDDCGTKHDTECN